MDTNNFVKVMYSEVYNVPTGVKELSSPDSQEDSKQESKKQKSKEPKPQPQEPKPKPQEPKPQPTKQESKKQRSDMLGQDEITLKDILNTVDYTIEGINKLYGHERYSYRETYKPNKFNTIDYHRKESCGPNKGTTIRDSMRNNNILCETQDYIDKHLLIDILRKLGMEKMESLFRLHNVVTIKDMINVDNKKLSSLGLNQVNIERFRKLVEKSIENNKLKVLNARKRACNCEYERFLKNMIFRDRYNDIQEDHVKPFKEARDMCEKCFKFEQELLLNGYVENNMKIEDSLEYLETEVYDKVEDIVDNKLSKTLKKLSPSKHYNSEGICARCSNHTKISRIRYYDDVYYLKDIICDDCLIVNECSFPKYIMKREIGLI